MGIYGCSHDVQMSIYANVEMISIFILEIQKF